MNTKAVVLSFLASCVSSAPVLAAPSSTLGFPLGEKSRVHTNLDMSVAFDSNPARFQDTGAGSVVSDWRGLVRPGLLVDVPGTSLAFNLRGQLSINQFFGVNGASDTTFGGDVGLGFSAGSGKSAVQLKVEDALVRTPTYLDEPGAVASDEVRFKEWANKGAVRLTLRPGGGALEFGIGYDNTLSFYDALTYSQRHGAVLEARYKFLPKTALFIHLDGSAFVPEKDGSNSLDATPIRATLGAIGQVTSKIAAHLEVGYGDSLTWTNGLFKGDVSPNNQRTVVGAADVTYTVNDASNISLGYERLVTPVIYLQNYVADTIRLKMVLGLFGRLVFSGYAAYEFRGFGGAGTAPQDLGAQVLTGDARVEYWFFEFLMAGLNYRIIRQAADDTVNPLLEDYTRHLAFLNVGLRY